MREAGDLAERDAVPGVEHPARESGDGLTRQRRERPVEVLLQKYQQYYLDDPTDTSQNRSKNQPL